MSGGRAKGKTLAFACSCGATHGSLNNITPTSGSQLQCHCDDCRRAVVWLGQPDPGPDGVRYYQTSPANVQFDAGKDRLQAFTWKNGKLLRWYAGCCNTPLFNTLNSPKWAFASLMVDRLETPDALGTSTAHAFIPQENGKHGHKNIGGFMWGFAKRVIGGRLTGSWRDTPFFDHAGTPVAPVQPLTKSDRDTATL